MYLDETPDGQTILLGTCSEVARCLNVSTNQVFMWAKRRQSTGFPKEKDRRLAFSGLKNVPHYNIEECRAWHATYTPNRGGYRMHRRNRADDDDDQ